MNFLRELLPNKKDRQDFFIALPVLALFFGAIIYTIFPSDKDRAIFSFFVDEASNAKQNIEANNVSQSPIADPISVESLHSSTSIKTEDAALTEYLLSDKATVESVDTWLDALDADKRTDLIVSDKDIDNPSATEMPLSAAEDSSAADMEASTNIDSLVNQDDQDSSETLSRDTIISMDNDLTRDHNIADDMVTVESSVSKENTNSTNEVSETLKKHEKALSTQQMKSSEISSPNATKTNISTKKKITTDYSAWKYKCLIIVGAFTRRDYANQLIRQLKQDGLPVHTFYRKGRLAVSIKHTCDNEAELQKALQEARKLYSKEAWILRR